MLPFSLPRIFDPVYCDGGPSSSSSSKTISAITSLKSAIKAPESELRRWRKTFDSNATVAKDDQKCVTYLLLWRMHAYVSITPLVFICRFLDKDSFVNAIAPSEDLTKIGREQYSILFKVADTQKRGLVSWDDFVVFQTLLKRPDADYWIAFQYFDVCVVAYLKLSMKFNEPVTLGTLLELLPSMSLKTYFRLIWARTAYLSTLIGELPALGSLGSNSLINV